MSVRHGVLSCRRSLHAVYVECHADYAQWRHVRLIVIVILIQLSFIKSDERAFRVAAPRLWNELPSDIRKASTLATFRNILDILILPTLWHCLQTITTPLCFCCVYIILHPYMFFYVYCTVLSLSIVSLHVCT